MRLLDRYLFRELLTPLAYCLGGFLTFWIAYDLFMELEELQERKLHALDVLAYILAMTPEFLVTVLPVALLLALLYTLANHARYNEITAMRAAGVSLWRICVPYFIIGFFASLALFVLNEFLAPRGADRANRILTRYVQKPGDGARDQFHGFANVREHRLWHFDEYRLQTAEMLNPQVNWNLPDGSGYQLNAPRAVCTNGVWMFFNATEEFLPANTNLPPVPVAPTNSSALAMPQFDETPAQIKSEIKISIYENRRDIRKADIPLADIQTYLRLHPDLPRAESAWLFTKFYGRLAAPWTCLVVVLIAIPFGATPGRRNLFFGVAGIIALTFTFFVLQSVSLAFGSGGELPAWLAAWLPNMIFAATGLFLMARVR